MVSIARPRSHDVKTLPLQKAHRQCFTQELGDDPMSNMIRQIMALFDEYQSKENAKHTLRAMKENADSESVLLRTLVAASSVKTAGRSGAPEEIRTSGREPWPRFARGLLFARFARFEISFDPIQPPIECDYLRS
jgi:hypothetical protein